MRGLVRSKPADSHTQEVSKWKTVENLQEYLVPSI